MKVVSFEGVVQLDSLDDSGTALILVIDPPEGPDEDKGIFVRLQSCDADAHVVEDHPTAGFIGRRVKVLIVPVQEDGV